MKVIALSISLMFIFAGLFSASSLVEETTTTEVAESTEVLQILNNKDLDRKTVVGEKEEAEVQETSENKNQKPYSSIDEYTTLIEDMQPKVSKKMAEEIAEITVVNAEEYGINPLWILAMMWQESSFLSHATSSHQAMGLMQILPSTAAAYGINKEELFDPQTNIAFGVQYLAELEEKLGSLKMATIAYNQGIGNVMRGHYRSEYYTLVKDNFDNFLNIYNIENK